MPNSSSSNLADAYAPAQVAGVVGSASVAKASLPATKTLVLAVLAGAFIAFGGMFYTVAVTETGLGFGPTRLLGGAAFSLGLILVVVAGAELFTGNKLIVMAWASRRIGTGRLMRNWGLVYLGDLVPVTLGNIVGGSGLFSLVHWTAYLRNDG